MDFDQVKNVFSAVAEKGKEYAGIAVDKTKSAGHIAKLSLELIGERDALKKAYVELGKAYYEECRETATGLFAQLCQEVDTVNARIAAKQQELDAQKANFTSSAATETADFNDVVSQDEAPVEETPAEEAPVEEAAAEPSCPCEDAADTTDAPEEE